MKFMLVINSGHINHAALVADYLEKQPPLVLQLTFARDADPMLQSVPRAGAAGVRIWMNSLLPDQNGGHHDNRALTDPTAPSAG